ncbi:MAG: serine hydrolase domain-containing protein, partial [Sulfurimonadaceae bacterium]|nr:serine hydrolase domain-containing protein [Sulfurimonadaceae bacterium]
MKPWIAVMVAAIWMHLHAGIAELEQFIASEVADGSPPSASVAVLHGDEVIYEKGFGYNDPDRRFPTTAQSVYNLYSLSKIVTATAVMQLVESGELELDDTLRSYFPRFRTLYEGEERNITVKQLLMHSAGVTDRSGDYRHMFDDDYFETLKEAGEEPEMFYILDYEPDSEAAYSNSGYIVLGYLIEKVTAQSFEEAVRKQVIERAKMEASGFDFRGSREADEVFGTLRFFSWLGQAMRLMVDDEDKNRYDGTMLWLKRYNVRWSPAGGLKGSIRDMRRFLQATHRLQLYGDGTYGRFLYTSPVKVDKMFSKFDDVKFGIGWYHLHDNGEMFYQHQGIGPGFRNIMRIYPDYGLSFVI